MRWIWLVIWGLRLKSHSGQLRSSSEWLDMFLGVCGLAVEIYSHNPLDARPILKLYVTSSANEVKLGWYITNAVLVLFEFNTSSDAKTFL